MQVGLTSSSLATGGAHSAAVSSSTVAPTQAVRQKLPATASEYPASPLITTMVDFLSLLIYFSIAVALLHIS